MDAVVGGGGLIQLPALLLGLPNATPVQILATNKLASICGTTVSSATYYRRVRPDPRTFLPLMALAFFGALGGALVATQIPREAFEPIVLVALIVVGGYVVLKPARRGDRAAVHGPPAPRRRDGDRARDRLLRRRARPGHRQLLRVHPGRPARLLVPRGERQGAAGELGDQPRRAGVFVPAGAVLWKVGLVMGVCNLLGGYLGARVAISRGAGFVRIFFIVVVSAFIVRIGGEVLGVW